MKAAGIPAHEADFRAKGVDVNYQPQSYGKWDIGPAFDWSRIIAALNPNATVPVAGVQTGAGAGT